MRLRALFDCRGALPKTAKKLTAVVLEIQKILLGVIEPHGRRHFPPTAHRLILARDLKHQWAEYKRARMNGPDYPHL
uniref:Integrase n=1 Tax=Globodera pallida TaxID=36090 RepID=A0A183CFQ3_GLOPA